MKILARSCMSADGLFSCPEIMATGEAIVLRKHFRRSGQTRYTLANASDFLDPLGAYALTQTPTYHFRRPSGADDGNRTRAVSLGSSSSTIKLRRRNAIDALPKSIALRIASRANALADVSVEVQDA